MLKKAIWKSYEPVKSQPKREVISIHKRDVRSSWQTLKKSHAFTGVKTKLSSPFNSNKIHYINLQGLKFK